MANTINSSRANSRFAPSQWEMLLQSSAISHWLGANLESAMLFWCWNWNILGWLGQYHACWCPGSLGHQQPLPRYWPIQNIQIPVFRNLILEKWEKSKYSKIANVFLCSRTTVDENWNKVNHHNWNGKLWCYQLSVDLSHNDFSPGGEQPKQCLFAHML